MTLQGFDIELSDIGKIPNTVEAFIFGWEIAYIFVIIVTFIGLIAAVMTKPKMR